MHQLAAPLTLGRPRHTWRLGWRRLRRRRVGVVPLRVLHVLLLLLLLEARVVLHVVLLLLLLEV